MQKIELRVEQQAGQAVPREWVAVFGMAGGTIGRGGQNKLVLPDADASVARVHAMVRLETDGAHIANLCERRPLFVDGRELRSGDEVPLRPDAKIGIGPYLLRARLPAEGGAWVTPSDTPPAVVTPVSVSSAVLDLPNPWSDIPQQTADVHGEAHGNPFAMLGRIEAPYAHDAAPAKAIPAQPVRPAPAVGAMAPIPEDFDPFAIDVRQQQSRASEPWLAGQPELSLQELSPQRHDGLLQGLEPVGRGHGGMDDACHAGLPAALSATDSVDPMRLFAGAQGGLTPTPQAQGGAHGDELAQVFALPRAAGHEPVNPPPSVVPTAFASDVAGALAPVAAPPPAEPAPRLDVATQALADAQALIQAFLDGAGVSAHQAAPALTPAFMQTFGELVRVSVQGTIELLAARAEVKKELRAGMTIIAAGANNPLKFLPTAEGVLLQMTGQAFPGFMQPVPAMQEAYRDLRVHQVALLAGIRAAYSEALTRFDPAEMERRSTPPGGLLARMSANSHKAALWDRYCEDYQALRRHAEDDLVAFSGQTFVQAYEAAAHAVGGAA
jgi:FHA domain-containing protein